MIILVKDNTIKFKTKKATKQQIIGMTIQSIKSILSLAYLISWNKLTVKFKSSLIKIDIT